MLTEACTGQYEPDPSQWSMNRVDSPAQGLREATIEARPAESGNPDSADRTKDPQGPIPIISEHGSRQGIKDDCRGKA